MSVYHLLNTGDRKT